MSSSVTVGTTAGADETSALPLPLGQPATAAVGQRRVEWAEATRVKAESTHGPMEKSRCHFRSMHQRVPLHTHPRRVWFRQVSKAATGQRPAGFAEYIPAGPWQAAVGRRHRVGP
eukprot:scaffold7974_cov112-Isochrysis_galbana.AAC.2